MAQNKEGRFRPLSARTRWVAVADSIRAAIQDGTLDAGTHLVEEQIAEEMGVSRAPVREAFRKLEEEGLIVNIPYKGTYVNKITRQTMIEIAALRTVTDTFAATKALSRLDDEGLNRLEELVSLMRAAAEAEDVVSLTESHLGFHRTIYALAGNAVLLQLWSLMEGQLRSFLRVNARMFTNLQETVENHAEIVRLLKTGDVELIGDCLNRHIMGNAERMLRVMPEQEDAIGGRSAER